MRAKFLSTSLLSLFLSYPILATSSQEDSALLPTSSCTPLCDDLQDARIYHKMGDFENADYRWSKLINAQLEKVPGVTDKDLSKALTAHIITTAHARSPENTARINGLMSLLSKDALVHAALMLHMNDAALNDVDFVMRPLLEDLHKSSDAAPRMIETLRKWVSSYDLKNSPLAHKGYDALSKICDLLHEPHTASDHLGRAFTYIRAYVLSSDPLILYESRSSFEASKSLLSTASERRRFHQGMAEVLTVQSRFRSIAPVREKKLGQDAANHWHQYWANIEDHSPVERGIYVRGVMNANAAAGQREQNFDILDVMPEDLTQWDILTLIYATQVHLDACDISKAIRFWQEAIAKAKTNEGATNFGPLLNISLFEIGRQMAFGAQTDLAIETLETSLELAKMTCDTAQDRSVIFHNQTQTHLDDKQKTTHLMLAYALSQKAMACADPNARKALFESAVDHIRASNYQTSLACTKEEAIRLGGALYFIISAVGNPTERKSILPSILENFFKIGAGPDTIALKRGPSHGRRKAPSLEDQGAKARGFLMATYGTFAEKELDKLAHLEQKLPLLGAPELYEASHHLKAQLVSLREAAKRPVRTKETAHVCLETTNLYNAAYTQVQEHASLWKSIEREIAKARAALPALASPSSSPVLLSSSSSSAPNYRSAYPHKKLPKIKKTQTRARHVTTQPSSSSSSTSYPVLTQEAAPSSVRILFSPQAEADRDILLTMPGMAGKLDLFLDEVKENPFATKINMASGRAEALRFMKDHYSRRFDKQNRFVYRTDRNDDGSITVTVLRLLTHYKR